MAAWQFVNSRSIGANQGPGNRGDLIAFLRPVLPETPDTKQKVLDVGCNTAWFAHLFDNYYGIDTDLNSIQVAHSFWQEQARWGEQELKNRIRQVSAASDWPEDLNAFDGIILRDVLEHAADSSQLFKLAVSRLKPGGWLFISAPDSQRWVWNDPTHVRPVPLKAQRCLTKWVGAELIREGYESVAPGTQKLARWFGGRSPFFVRLLTRLRWWPRNAISLVKNPKKV